MAKLIFSPLAQSDLGEVFDYIAQDKPIAAANWIDTIENTCRFISTSPKIGELRPALGGGIRSSVAGHYVIYYRAIRGGIEGIRVIAGGHNTEGLEF